jgi:trimeric autotransporter adhesin
VSRSSSLVRPDCWAPLPLTARSSGGSDEGETVYLCADNGGALRLVSSPSSCKKNEKSLALATEAALAARDTRITSLEGRVTALETANTSLQGKVGSLEALLAGVTRDGRTLKFTGMNLQIVNGQDSTATTNSLGNLIIGYNAQPTTSATRSGSHYLVVGDQHEWTSYGGILVGYRNTASAPWASVSGGAGNAASGNWASVSGGAGNTASGGGASVSGGQANTASGYAASVSGGGFNTSRGDWTSVAGGEYNTAGYDQAASVSGGRGNTASGQSASVSGGANNTASSYFASVSGGGSNTASAFRSSVSGGDSNTASGDASSILGGQSQTVNIATVCHPDCN